MTPSRKSRDFSQWWLTHREVIVFSFNSFTDGYEFKVGMSYVNYLFINSMCNVADHISYVDRCS